MSRLSRYDVPITAVDQKQIDAFLARPTKVQLVGQCAGCKRGVPHGYPYRVTKWGRGQWGNTPVHIPAEVWCKECTGNIIPTPRHKHRVEAPKPSAQSSVTLTPKQIAEAIWPKLSTEHGFRSRRLAKKIKIDPSLHDATIKAILKKLAEAGKVELRNGKWWKL